MTEWDKIRFQLMEELKEKLAWIKKQDSKGESQRMQGARYAYAMCLKRLKKL